MNSILRISAAALALSIATPGASAPVEPLYSMVKKEEPAVVTTLRDLVNIESGSRDHVSRYIERVLRNQL